MPAPARPRPTRSQQPGLQLRALLAGLGGTLVVGLAALRGGYAPWAQATVRRQVVSPAALEVVDGDTLRLRGRELRLLGVDTPERAAPWFDGAQEPWAGRAAALVRAEVARARSATLLVTGRRDGYGRELVHLLLDDHPLALSLVRAGLAYPTVERFGTQGFPLLAARLVREARPPEFEPPWEWRRRHRRSLSGSLASPAEARYAPARDEVPAAASPQPR